MSRHRRGLGLLTGLALSLPARALACPVCFSATEANRDAFLGTTILLSLLPLLFVGGVVWVLRARILAREAGDISHPREGAHGAHFPKSDETSASEPLVALVQPASGQTNNT